jgi:SAM-dependent methyltransferase
MESQNENATVLPHSPEELSRIYSTRFGGREKFRRRVWSVLIDSFFQKYIPANGSVLDLGCGYGEFINQIKAGKRFAMDLNPEAPRFLDPSVQFIHQDCSQSWKIEGESLDTVFTSNFFEHLPNKDALGRTLSHVHKALKPGGRLIAMGPNIKVLKGAYWDFWDHYLPLTELSLKEALTHRGFRVDTAIERFLPYTMVNSREYPDFVLKLYLSLPVLWRIKGGQFLVIATR